METLAVIDFETTGLYPQYGDRATEIAVMLVRNGHIVDRFQSLMNAGVRINGFITSLTGITNDMVRAARPASRVMREVADFVGATPLVAHNATFDRRFWDAELDRIGCTRRQDFACSMLIARRVLPDAPDHKLSTLVSFAGLPVIGDYHRAEADAEMAAHLVLYLTEQLMERFHLNEVPHALLARIQKTPKYQLQRCVEGYRRAGI
ncbi:MAG: 3'-5' exonuclease [Chromatiaceae bacterium]|jgi:DNA polymerase-3 subunit epsilon|nr:3'-5' exonuclease [Chromatiaceae bacterium]